MRLLHVVGTRPNFMKVAPVIQALARIGAAEQRLVHTGQHYDRELSGSFLDDLDLPYPDDFLEVGSGTHAAQTARVMVSLEAILVDRTPDAIVVPGDVNSTMAAALAAVKLRVPVVHLEAGLRSYDRSMPEEHNRVVTDHVADLLLTPSHDADENLIREGIPKSRIRLVGNAMIDSLRRCEPAARALDVARADYGVEDYLLVTLHRPDLADDQDALLEVMHALEDVATERPVLFPVHPRTASTLKSVGWRERKVRLLPPESYLRFLSLLLDAFAVLTDSGGIQEETTVLGIPCFTLRSTTERPVTVRHGTNRVLGVGPEALCTFREQLPAARRVAPVAPPGWDGRAAERVADVLVQSYGGERPAESRPPVAHL